jgi:hypothetical protein
VAGDDIFDVLCLDRDESADGGFVWRCGCVAEVDVGDPETDTSNPRVDVGEGVKSSRGER